MPELVTVLVVDAVIGPGKSDGTQWDGYEYVPSSIRSDLAKVIGGGIRSKILDWLLSVANQGLAKPDPYGWVELDVGNGYEADAWLAGTGDNTEDTFTPIWPGGGSGWSEVPFVSDLRLRVTLFDEDLVNDDDIGVAVINFDDVLEAWADGSKYYVLTADQTANQLLMVGIEVFE